LSTSQVIRVEPVSDLLVIGSGVAGLSAAIAAQGKSKHVLLVSKGPIAKQSCSAYAGGQFSVHLPKSTEDGFRKWLADSPLTDRIVAGILAKEVKPQIQTLMEYGLTLRSSQEGGYRIDNSGSKYRSGGATMISRLTQTARDMGVKMIPNFTTTRLLVSDNRCFGAMGFRDQGEFLRIDAKTVVLASGGACRIYQHNSNPPGITGDGYAMLLKAGAQLVNVEFIRFFPLGLPSFRFPVHRLYRRFYDVEGLRAVTSQGEDIFQKHMGQSIKEAMKNTYSRFVTMSSVVEREKRVGDVFLDFTRVPAPTWNRITSTGVDNLIHQWGGSPVLWNRLLKKTRILPTAPIAQTFVGGARVGPNMATGVEGLFAAGEVVNFCFDLGSDEPCEIGPLTCALTSGAIAGREAAIAADQAQKPRPQTFEYTKEWLRSLRQMMERKKGPVPQMIVKEIRKIMTRYCGPLRTDALLREGLEKLKRVEAKTTQLRIQSPCNLSQALEAQNMTLVSRAVLEAALMRQESRSEHYREDFPSRDNNRWLKNIVVSQNDYEMPSLRATPIKRDLNDVKSTRML